MVGQFDNIAPEVLAKAKACKTPEELLALAKQEGYELSDAQLEAASGGWETCEEEYDPYDNCPEKCPDDWQRFG